MIINGKNGSFLEIWSKAGTNTMKQTLQLLKEMGVNVENLHTLSNRHCEMVALVTIGVFHVNVCEQCSTKIEY